MEGKLFLIPKDIGGNPSESIPQYTLSAIKTIDTFIVEEVRTARRFLAALGIKVQELTFIPWGKHTDKSDVEGVLAPLKQGKHIGIISESGCPAVADPGKNIVLSAHKAGYSVVPLIGPSSILMALMASGLNGQNFCFHGYLPKDPERRQFTLKKLERNSAKYRQTQFSWRHPLGLSTY